MTRSTPRPSGSATSSALATGSPSSTTSATAGGIRSSSRTSCPPWGSSARSAATAAGACPPEDVGGPWGYGDFLDAIGDPQHDRHDELLEWIGGSFDPAAFDAAETDGIFAALADPT